MIDTDTAESPGWWLKVLAREMHNRRCGRDDSGGRRRRYSRTGVDSSRVRPGLDTLNDYYRGDPPLRADIHAGWAEPFRQYVRMGRLNFAGLSVSAPAARMGIRDFRTAAAQDELGDAKARDIMRANDLKLVSRDVHENMFAFGDGYVMLTPQDTATDRIPLITSESPLTTITAHDAATGKTLAGLKMFRDEWVEREWAYLFIDGVGLMVAYKDGRSVLGADSWFRFSAQSWSWKEDKFDANIPDGNAVPIVRFKNKGGVGEFENHLDHLDRINDKVFNEWWIGKINGFRQRALKNLPDRDEGTGELIDYTGMFTSSPDSLWRLPADSDIWESTVVDIGPLVNSVQKELQWFAAALSMPLQTLAPDAANQSAEGATTLKEEQLFKIEDRRERAEGGWSRVMGKAFEYMGDVERSDRTKIEPLWGPLQRFTLAQMSEAAQKSKGILPDETIWTDIYQYPPAEVANLRTLRGRDLLFNAPKPGAPGASAPVPADAPAPPAAG